MPIPVEFLKLETKKIKGFGSNTGTLKTCLSTTVGFYDLSRTLVGLIRYLPSEYLA